MSASNEFAFDGSVRSYDVNGHMHVAVSPITKATVNPYYGREIPCFEQLGLQPDRVYQLLRDPLELEKAVDTFNSLPILIKHEPISAEELPKELIVGTTGSDATWCAPYISMSLTIWEAGAIAGIQTKEQTELSSGYRYTADMTPGTFEGIPYDGVMRDIQGNHVALVDFGRAGRDVVVGDKNPFKEQSMTEEEKKAAAAAAKHQKAVDKATAKILPLLGADAQPEALKAELLALAMDADPEKPEGANDEGNDDEGKTTTAQDDEGDDDGEKKPPGANDEGEENEEGKKKPAMDRASINKVMQMAEDRAVARIEALYKARDAVVPLVGVVAMDSAEAVYRFALEKSGISTKGVDSSAFPAMTNMLLKQHQAQQAMPQTRMGMDSAAISATEKAHPGIGRFKQA